MKNINNKEEIKDFGIMTFYSAKNYGAALQAFALQEIVSKMGYSSEFLRFHDSLSNPKAIKKTFKHYFNVLKEIGFGVFVLKKTDAARHGVQQAFERFRKEFFHIGEESLCSVEDLKQIDKDFKGFICGSDMVWSNIGQNLEAYFLQFANPVKRISYAPSLTGTEKFSEVLHKNMATYINGIRFLSCREKEGVDYVKSATNRSAELTLDPTLLFTKEQWKTLLSLSSTEPKKHYILCYMFGGTPKSINRNIRKIAKKKDLDIRYIPMNVSEYKSELESGFSAAYGPGEFVELFFNADFVVTNSFHGFLFSLISEIPFVVVHRDNKSEWKSNEERIFNILRMVEQEERYIDLNEKFTDEFFTIDYNNVIREKISEEREQSYNYLSNAVTTVYREQTTA